MWDVSQRFLDTLPKSHDIISKAEILLDGVPIITIEGKFVTDPATGKRVSAVGGNVAVSRSNIRRSGSADFINLDGILTRSDIRELFVPLRNEIRLYSGVVYWDSTNDEIKKGTDREYVPVGTLVIDKVRSSWPRLSVTGYDRMWIIQRSTFTSPYTVAKSTNALDAVQQMFRSALPGPKQDFNFPESDETTPLSVWDEQADRADAGQQIANSAGYVVYVDPMGTFRAVVEPEPTPDNVVFRYVPGTDSQMFRPEEEISGTDAYNAVVAKGESPDGVVAASRGYAVDSNPRSLTYSGEIGIFPYFYTSPLLDSKAKAQSAADTILRRELGLADTIVVPVLPNPAHESGDVIYVEDPEQEIADVLIIDDFPIPIRATDGVQELSCRAQVFS